MTIEKDYEREEKLKDIGQLIDKCTTIDSKLTTQKAENIGEEISTIAEKGCNKVQDLTDIINSTIDKDYGIMAERPKDLGQLVKMTVEKDYSKQVDQDQQVPESRYSGAKVTTQESEAPSGIPDFETLLTDLEAVGALDTGLDSDKSADMMEYTYTERSFYDDYGVAHIKKEPMIDTKTVDVALKTAAAMPHQDGLYGNDLTLLGEDTYNYYQNPRLSQVANQHTNQGMEDLALTPEEPFNADSDYETIQKIDRASVELGISKNPYNWEPEHSHRWAEWTLKMYNLPTSYVMDFYMDGTLMCMLTNEDFQKRCPLYGDYLFAELELWKSAYNLISSPLHNASSSSSCTSDEEEPCYTDLSGPAMPQATMSAIPTPVIMPPQYTGSVAGTHYPPQEPTLMQAAQGHRPAPRMLQSCVSPAPSLDSLNSSGQGSWASTPDDMTGITIADSTYEMGAAQMPGRKHAIHLWQFLKELLLQPQAYHNCIRWLDRSKGIFKIEDSSRVAKLWGQRKNRPAMNYDKLSRSIRQYYKKGIIKKTENSKRLVYQFQPQYR